VDEASERMRGRADGCFADGGCWVGAGSGCAADCEWPATDGWPGIYECGRKTDPEFPNVDVVYTLTGADGKPIEAKPGDLRLFSQGVELERRLPYAGLSRLGMG